MLCFSDNFTIVIDNGNNTKELLKTMNKTFEKKSNIKIKIKVLVCGRVNNTRGRINIPTIKT